MDLFYILTIPVLFGVAQAAVYELHPAYLSKIMPAGSVAKAFSVGNMVMVPCLTSGQHQAPIDSQYLAGNIFCLIRYKE